MSFRMLFLFSLVFAGGVISYQNIKPFYVYEQTPKLLKKGLGRCDIEKNGEKLILKKYLKPHMVVFDVGANVGVWSHSALEVEPDIELYSFEPIKHVFGKLSGEFLNQKNVHAYNLALSNENRKLSFPFDSEEKDSVDVQKLDDFCLRQNISRIDFLKIDTKGAEWQVLEGAQKMLEGEKIGFIQFEYGKSYFDAKMELKKVMQHLSKQGYALFRIVPKGLIHLTHWEDSMENYKYSNYFAILRNEFPEYSEMQF